MLQGSFRKTTLNAIASFEAIPPDVWIWALAPVLEAAEVLPLRAVSTAWRQQMSDDDVWLTKLTALSLQYPSTSQLDQGSEETAFAWFWRCSRAIGSGDALARRHKAGEYPYLLLYGSVNSNTFSPFADMRFPIEQGAIAELIDLMSRSGSFADPAFDAAQLFHGVPESVMIDGSFRLIHAAVKTKRAAARENDLRALPELLAKLYSPRSVVAAAASPAASSSADSPPTATATTPSTSAPPKLLLRLRRMGAELQRANERIALLEGENVRLRVENAELRAANAELRSENRQLRAAKRGLEQDMEAAEGELHRMQEAAAHELQGVEAALQKAEGELAGQRRARAALVRQLDAMIAERDRLRLLRDAAERSFEKAQATVDRERGRVNEARDAAAAARRHEAEVERDAAAQVAAAQHSATEAIEAEVATRLRERGLMTVQQFVEYAQVEAAVGMISPPFRKVAAHVMAAECSASGKAATLPAASADGKGAGVTYMRVVRSIKPSNQLSPRQLHDRTQQLRASLTQVSGGGKEADVAQLRHFMKSQKALVQEALEGTWLSPPKKLNLEMLISLRAEMSGAMYDSLISFIRRKTGIKTDATRKEVKAAFDDFKFEYETGKFTSVDDKEVEVDGKKVVKRVTTNGYYLRVKDPLAVLRQSAAVHAKEGRLGWPSCVPSSVYPICVMLDAGGGSTKVVLKHPCVVRADSVRAITLLAVMTGAKDTQSAMKIAFGPILEACSEFNRTHTYVNLLWAPQLPADGTFELRGDAKVPTKKM